MRGAAAVLLRQGMKVSGSDKSASAELTQLSEQGVQTYVGQSPGNLPDPCDLVVRSAAIKDSNPELVEAQRRGCPVIKYSELLGLLMADRVGIAVAGTHGKSTTTAMAAFVMQQVGLDPSFVIGAHVGQLGGGSGVGDGEHFIVEACEYDRSFLNLKARYATILNIEEDHLDYYKDLGEIVHAFRSFAALVTPGGVLMVNGENRYALQAAQGAAAKVETFGFEGGLNWTAQTLGSQRGCFRFRVVRDDRPLTEVKLAIPGPHHVTNALAALAICLHCGLEPETIAQTLGEFQGADRRLTWRGCIRGVNVVDDYAHHPTELQVTIKAAREYYKPDKLFVVFQPHQHSRTRFMLNDFARSFGAADVVLVPDIYFVRDTQAERDLVDARDLVEKIRLNGGEARYESSFTRIASQLCREVRPGDLVVTMGAGDVWQIADDLLSCLAKTQNG
jgi:UDP-N-acetylmuramate--alanine ligase